MLYTQDNYMLSVVRDKYHSVSLWQRDGRSGRPTSPLAAIALISAEKTQPILTFCSFSYRDTISRNLRSDIQLKICS